MSADNPQSPLCARVLDRLVDRAGGAGPLEDFGDDPLLSDHLGTCMTCFRALTELRDAPRLAAILRADPPSLPESDGFWEELAVRNIEAAAAGQGGAPLAVPRVRRWSRVPAIVFATAVAAAAAFLLVPRPPEPIAPGLGAKRPAAAEVARMVSDDEPGEAADVGDLDQAALGRLLDRLRAGAPGALTASVGGDLADGSDSLLDDESQVNDELAELDGPALLRVERSLGRTSL